MTPINIGSAPNDGTGQTLRSAFQTVNENITDTQSQLDGKAPTVHGHSMAQISGLTETLDTLQDNIDILSTSLQDYAGTDVYALINDLQNLITAQNNVILQQNATINEQQDTINYILSILNP